VGYLVALLNFEGPLDLLLQLVERAELATTELSLSDLTDQYLMYIDDLPELNPVETSRFANVAAKLLYIKSLSLLPGVTSQEAAEETAELQRQLADYSAHQAAAERLTVLLEHSGSSWGRSAPPTDTTDAEAPTTVSVLQLQRAYQQALVRTEATPHTMPKSQLSLPEAIQKLTARLKQRSQLRLEDLFQDTRTTPEVVVTFLAALELWKQGQIKLTQRAQFSMIEVDYAATSPSA
jgi:segregation and condensation protein A